MHRAQHLAQHPRGGVRLTCKGYFNWLSLLPRRLKPMLAGRWSAADWQAMQVRTPGIASRRACGISLPHSTQ
ncbi:MAG TPA: hypothetical protein PLZ81_17495 [Acidiphilium rubrum]|nr:hypothetical protein [Acidiphilium rubrum]HQT86645.1 hypothetical protein [Acidiphilium rubrum]